MSLMTALSCSQSVSCLGVTRTRLGITSRNVLAALDSFSILSLDRRFLDPRCVCVCVGGWRRLGRAHTACAQPAIRRTDGARKAGGSRSVQRILANVSPGCAVSWLGGAVSRVYRVRCAQVRVCAVAQVAHTTLLSSAPAVLESTTFVLASGLDVYFTRAMPSKSFDILDAEFNRGLLLALTGTLFVATIVLSRMAAKAQLAMQWK